MTEPLVRRVDHVVVPVRDPEPLFSLFGATLGLPVAWEITDKGAFTSGAVCAGNANLEFITGAAALSPLLTPTEPLTVRGIALEPEDGSRMTASLDERGLPHSGTLPHAGDGGDWTNVFLGEMIADAAVVFLCDYHGETLAERRAVRKAFPASDGGALGVRRVAEVTLGIRSFDEAMERWRRLLAPREPDEHGAFLFDEGPAVRLRRSPMDGVAGLWLEVSSLADAREALRERDLLGPMRASGIGLDYARTGGLDVWLTERR